jgi:putative acetyltransferase
MPVMFTAGMVEIRSEQATDQQAVLAVHASAFADHGGVVVDLVKALRELVTATAGLSLVAEINGQVIGHVMFTPSLLDAPSRLVSIDVLSPLAVSPDYQRRGIGGSLIEAGVAIQATRGVPAILLEGDPSYYSRFGFQPAGPLGFRRPSLRIPQPAFQVMRLPTYERWMIGTLVYAHQFWDHDAVGLRDHQP